MPRTVRIKFKSGVLPQPRQPVPRMKADFELAEEAKLPSGFSDPQMAPRGSAANPPPRLPKTVAEKIAGSARAPRHADDRGTAEVPEARWKRHIADVRRSYYESSLRAYEAQEVRHKELREQRKRADDAKSATKLTEVTESLATALTTPTIDASLTHGMVVKRTPEEAEELRLKREYNRRLTQQQCLEKEQEALLTLYQQASNFIVTEDQLEARVAAQFKPVRSLPAIGTNDTQTPTWWKYLRPDLSPAQVKRRSREDELVDAALGTVKIKDGAAVRYAPGLKATKEALRAKEEGQDN